MTKNHGIANVAPVAATGFARQAAAYAKGRPGYPDAIRAWLHRALGIGAGSSVVEVGAGTGLFTRELVAVGAEVIAVDPVTEMLAELQRDLPDVQTLAAAADAIPLATGSVDAIVCATAFHWFATPAVLEEFHRLLRPGGMLGLVWNIRDERVAWVKRLSDITNVHAGEVVRQRDEGWRDPFPESRFSPLVETEMPYEHRGSADDVVVGRTLSTSFIAALDSATQCATLDEVRGLIAGTPELAGDEVTFPYVTTAYACRRLD